MDAPRWVLAARTPPHEKLRRLDQVRRPEPESTDSKRAELLALLIGENVPEKDEILRVKELIREISHDGGVAEPGGRDVKDFISAYLDLYIGRMTGEKAIEQAGLRRCLDYLGVPRRSATLTQEGLQDGPPT